MANVNDGLAAAVSPLPGTTANGVYRLDVSGTAATVSVVAGLYIVTLTSGCADGVSLRESGTAAEPSSGNAGTGAHFKDGWTYQHATTGNVSAVAVNSGSGRMYLTRVP